MAIKWFDPGFAGRVGAQQDVLDGAEESDAVVSEVKEGAMSLAQFRWLAARVVTAGFWDARSEDILAMSFVRRPSGGIDCVVQGLKAKPLADVEQKTSGKPDYIVGVVIPD